ncbi:MAG: UDP-N-acetylmuramate dehydrogenase [Bacteroidales bacterium]|nr:UDP-N-acetylmuramate dehydrogenase [Bacteroidales bacterium]
MELNFNLKDYNTFGLTCFAAKFLEVRHTEDLFLLHSIFGKEKLFILGFGANVVFATPHFDGVVAKMNNKGYDITFENEHILKVEVAAGEIWDGFVDWATERNLSGAENLAGIPSSVGASPVQNIGAYGAEVKDIIDYVTVYDLYENKFIKLSQEDCKFGYRNSVFKYQKGNLIIWKVGFCLNKNFVPNSDYKDIKIKLSQLNNIKLNPQLMAGIVREIRNTKLPDYKQNANVCSFFKNPVIPNEQYDILESKYPGIVAFEDNNGKKISAAWLIEQCGYKGKRIGNLAMHKSQALCMINCGQATGKEVEDFAAMIKKDIQEKFAIDLSIEAHIIK